MTSAIFNELLNEYADEQLIHEYDPALRRERYLRDRQLKGRRKGSGQITSTRSTPTPPAIVSRKERAARVKALQAKLDRLEALLARLVREAKARSGGDPNNTTKTKTSVSTSKTGGGSKGSDSDRKLTPKQKREAAARSKKYYDEHKKEKPPDVEEVRAKIKEIKEEIRKMREQLSNETASKGR